MKRIVAIILCAASLLVLCACGAKPDFYELDSAKVKGITFVLAPNAKIDSEEFVDAYNKAEVKGEADEDDTSKDVIVVTADDGPVTLYWLKNDKFAVAGSNIENNYIIDAPELYELYNGIIDPTAEFVDFDAVNYTVTAVKNPDADIDGAPFVKAYNDAKFIGIAGEASSNETLVFICNDGEYTFTMSYYKEDMFIISGSEIKVPYIVESARLAELYESTVE